MACPTVRGRAALGSGAGGWCVCLGGEAQGGPPPICDQRIGRGAGLGRAPLLHAGAAAPRCAPGPLAGAPAPPFPRGWDRPSPALPGLASVAQEVGAPLAAPWPPWGEGWGARQRAARGRGWPAGQARAPGRVRREGTGRGGALGQITPRQRHRERRPSEGAKVAGRKAACPGGHRPSILLGPRVQTPPSLSKARHPRIGLNSSPNPIKGLATGGHTALSLKDLPFGGQTPLGDSSRGSRFGLAGREILFCFVLIFMKGTVQIYILRGHSLTLLSFLFSF